MKKTILNLLIGTSLTFLASIHGYAQCTTTNVVEAVENGSFEKGYLKATGRKFSDGSIRNFKSDLTYAGDVNLANPTCMYGIGDKWGITKQETSNCGGNNPLYGNGYTRENTWIDHTLGTKDGFAFVCDLFTCSGAGAVSKIYTGGNPVLWAQDVNIFPNQNYYFSTWIAQYSSAPQSGKVYLVVIPYIGNTLSTANRMVISTLSPALKSMNWEQFYGTWNSAGYTKALITIEADPTATNCSVGGDYAIDDISFRNDCSNIQAVIKPGFNSNVNFCTSKGFVTLDANISTAPSRTFNWYKGNGNVQEEIQSIQPLTNTYVATSPGVYRVCVTDPANTCAASATIIVDSTINASIIANDLCSPVTSNIAVNVLGDNDLSKYKFQWTVPQGAIAPTNNTTSSFTSNVAGTYSVSMYNNYISALVCTTTVNKTIISKLPVLNVAPEQCYGSTLQLTGITSNVINANNLNWYDAAIGGTLLSSGAEPTFTYPNTGNNFTVYVADETVTPIVGSPLLNYSFNNIYYNFNSITLDIKTPITLESLNIKQDTWTGSCTNTGTSNIAIELLSGNTVVQTASFTVNCGVEKTINPNFKLPVGIYTLKVKGTGNNASATFSTYYNSSLTSFVIQNYVTVNTVSNSTPFVKLQFANQTGCDRMPYSIPLKNCVTGIDTNVDSGLNIYPNPVSNTLFLNQKVEGTVSITDLSGKIVLTKNISSVTIDISALNNGMYLIGLPSNGNLTWLKFIKE